MISVHYKKSWEVLILFSPKLTEKITRMKKKGYIVVEEVNAMDKERWWETQRAWAERSWEIKESASAVTIFIIKKPAKNLSQNIKQNPS